MEEPLVSIVIPVYNEESCLARTLTSVCEQDYRALQILIVDDGSTDASPAIARQFAEKDPRITVMTIPSSDVSAARNTALPLCRGRYIRFVDGDDTVPPGALRQMVARAEADGADLVIAGYTRYAGEIHRDFNRANRADTLSGHEVLRLLCPNANSYFFGVLWNKLFRATLINRQPAVRFESGLTYGEDFAFVTDFLQHAETIAFMKEPVYEYRQTANSMTVKQAWDSVIHPVKNSRVKFRLYQHFKKLYQVRGEYDAYRHRLWMYLIRVGLS